MNRGSIILRKPSSFILILLINLLAKTLLCCYIFVLLMTDVGHAFYVTGGISENLQFQSEHRLESWQQHVKKSFAMYDNLNSFSLKSNPEPIVYPSAGCFIPCDLITYNIPLHTGIHHPAITVENSLANLVYANLKLKRLLEAHEALQKKLAKPWRVSPFLLSNPDPPFLTRLSQNFLSTEYKTTLKENDVL